MAEEVITRVKPIEPILGRHSEIQAIITIPAGGSITAKVAPPNTKTSFYWTAYAVDCEPDSFKAKALGTPDIFPHEAILSPAVERVVDKNLGLIKPLITVREPITITITNITEVDKEIEIVLGVQYADIKTTEPLRVERKTYVEA